VNRIKVEDERVKEICDKTGFDYFSLDIEYDETYNLVDLHFPRPMQWIGLSKKDVLHMLAMFEN